VTPTPPSHSNENFLVINKEDTLGPCGKGLFSNEFGFRFYLNDRQKRLSEQISRKIFVYIKVQIEFHVDMVYVHC